MSYKLAKLSAKVFYKKHKLASRIGAVLMAVLILFGLYYQIFTSRQVLQMQVSPSAVNTIIGEPSKLFANKIAPDTKGGYNYNQGFSLASAEASGDNLTPKISANFAPESNKGTVTVKDAMNGVSISLTPKFAVQAPAQESNRIVYPILNKLRSLVYTVKATGIKEDLVLYKYQANELDFSYDVAIPDGSEIRIENNGTAAVYGVEQALLGNVTTGSESDAKLLEQARKSSAKTTLLFIIPAPVILDGHKQVSKQAKASYLLNGKVLTVHVEGLKNAKYPLSIDPSIYVETAAKLMRGNNETNIAFDATNELIQKSQTTGARINAWSSTTGLNTAVWDQGTVVAGGYIYSIGGQGSATTTKSTFYKAGSTTYNVPAGVTAITVKAWGAGGGGGSGNNNGITGGAGGGGGFAQADIIVTPAETINVDIGIAGAKGDSNNNGGNGGYSAVRRSTTFLIQAGGGGGGSGVKAGVVGGGDLVTGINTTKTSGSGFTPGNNSDSDRSTAAAGGEGGNTTVPALAGTAGAIVISYVIPGSTQSAVNWSRINTSTGAVTSPNPGDGTCSGWCTNAVYNLPVALRGTSVVTYNGFIYVMGGVDASGTRQSAVYIAKLGANGEPQLWNPTSVGTPIYWYTSALKGSVAKSYFAAYAYNNRMYVLGGQTNAFTTGISTVEETDILPTGDIGSWTTIGMQSLPGSAGLYQLSVHVYNDTMYILGGFNGANNSTTNLKNTTYYSHIYSDGTMETWQSTSSFSSPRSTFGGVFSAVWGAYIYLGGGCKAINNNGYCTSIASDVQIASINADGSLSEFNSIEGVTNQLQGFGMIAWQDSLYRVGGCLGQNTSTGDCTTTTAKVDYGNINQDGDASTVATSVPSGTVPCSGGSPNSCDYPSANVGNLLGAAIIMNGYLYIMGGCTVNDCTTLSSGVVYTAIASDGTLTKPSVCTGGTYADSYCVSPTNLPTALGAPGTAIFNGRMYIVGGFTAAGAVNNIYYTAINNDGSIGEWGKKALSGGTNVGATSVSYTYAYARANPASIGTNPGNLYIMGGCSAPAGVTCSGQTQNVYKCTIDTFGVPVTNGCSTAGQLQIGTVNTVDPTTHVVTNGSSTGLGTHSGTVYANYVYLMGGLGGGLQDITTVRYAKFDNSNNLVNPTNGGTSGGWIEDDTNVMAIGRRRGAAFGYNGHLYVLGGYDGIGSQPLADIEFAKISVNDGTWGAFSTSTVTINKRWGLVVPVSNSYAYVIGGCTTGTAPNGCTTRTNTVQSFQIYNNDSGAIKNVTAGNNLGLDRIGGSSTVMNGYIYYAAGCKDMACTETSTNTFYAAIDVYGVVGKWSVGGAIPTALSWGKLLNAGGTLYYVGGQTGASNSTAVGTVYYTSSIGSGNPIWSGSGTTKGLGDIGGGAQARTEIGAAVWDNRLYVTGGFSAAGIAQSTTYVSPQLDSGGDITSNWTSTAAFNFARGGHTLISYSNNLYLLGGFDGANYMYDVQFASIGYKAGTIEQSGNTIIGTGTTFTGAMVGSKVLYSDGSTSNITAFSSTTSITVDVSRTLTLGAVYTILDGSIGSWTYTTSLTGPLRNADGFAANGYLYIDGGRSAANTCAPNTQIVGISANTSIDTGNNPTGIGEWYETNTRYTGDRYGAAAAYSQGRVYLIGGGCNGSFVSNSDRMYYSTLKSQPQVSKYSRIIDTDSDVFPTGWLLNGIDNSIGARWQVRYKTMTNTTTSCKSLAMTTWGQETNFGNVTLGLVNSYTPLDGSGITTNCARYYDFVVSIDASQNFGYPEDISRDPTIADLSLFFTADPSKRLRHGKTFTGGEQQPIDISL